MKRKCEYIGEKRSTETKGEGKTNTRREGIDFGLIKGDVEDLGRLT